MEKKVLLVDDDKDLTGLVSMHLKEAGYRVEIRNAADAGLQEALGSNYDLIVLDLNMPGMSGMEICRQVRAVKTRVPILMLTSKADEIDKVLALELGADDYVTKPFGVRELMARVSALIRRATAIPSEAEGGMGELKVLTFAELTVDLEKRKVTLKGKNIELTATEFDLLSFLASHAGKPFNRDQLLSSVWGYQFAGYEHTVNSHINRLRSKIEKDPSKPRFILTVWGVGYKFADPAELQ
jgi:two-component system, OmpR family, alkaline phosphatase synthesis response regulator PhoP